MRHRSRFAVLVLATMLAACAQSPGTGTAELPDTREADAAAIHAAIADWSAASQAKDVEAFASVYADDAVLMLEGAPDISGIDNLREGLAGMMQDPNFSLSFAADDVQVARAGDLAYETGTYTMTMTDPDDGPVTQSGRYIVLWEKQADGAWKVIYDVPVSD